MKLLIINGNACKGSKTGQLTQLFYQIIEKKEVDTQLFDLSETVLPIMDGQKETFENENVLMVQMLATQADAFLLVTPEYHSSMSGALKNLLDFLNNKHFRQKPVALVATAGGGKGGINALNNLRMTVRGLHGWVLPEQVVVDSQDYQNDNQLDEAVLERVKKVATELVDFTRKVKQ